MSTPLSAPNLLVETNDAIGNSEPLTPGINEETQPTENWPDLWDRIRGQYQLDLSENNKRIQAQLNWYKRHQGYLNRVTKRAERYMYFIMEQIEVRDMPGEMALLPIVDR